MTMLDNHDRKFIPTVKAIVPQKRVESQQNLQALSSGSKVSLTVNVGSNQGIAPKFIVGAIVQGTELPAKSIGKIDIYADHSEVKMSKNDAMMVLDMMQNTKIKGCTVKFGIKALANDRGNDRRSFEKGYNRNRQGGRHNEFSGSKGRKDNFTKRFQKNSVGMKSAI